MTALLDELEQSICNPQIASLLVRSLIRILQLSPEKTVTSFKTLDAVFRVLKVACAQAQESRRCGNVNSSSEDNYMEVALPQHKKKSDLPGTIQSWLNCMALCVELFAKFLSVAEDTRNMILHSSTSIDCLFDLFWEEGLRNDVLRQILELMKVFPYNYFLLLLLLMLYFHYQWKSFSASYLYVIYFAALFNAILPGCTIF